MGVDDAANSEHANPHRIAGMLYVVPTPARGLWPELTLDSWTDTRDTFHLWTQIVGKVRMAFAAHVNHWWQVPLYVTARGLTTSLVHAPGQAFEIEIDMTEHRLVVRSSTRAGRNLALEPMPTADFYARTMGALDDLGIEVDILARPVELVEVIPFARRHNPPLLRPRRRAPVPPGARAGRPTAQGVPRPVPGQVESGALLLGRADMATTFFSGRAAPRHPGGVPNCPDWVMVESYRSELSSCGFWPGGSEEGSFYAYAYPEPDGYRTWAGIPSEASFDEALGEYILPYRAVRQADDPDALVLGFLQAGYDAAADLGGWNRDALDDSGRDETHGAEGPAGGAERH